MLRILPLSDPLVVYVSFCSPDTTTTAASTLVIDTIHYYIPESALLDPFRDLFALPDPWIL